MSSRVPFLLRSLIPPLRSNFSVHSSREKKGSKPKDEDGSLSSCAFSFELTYPFNEIRTDNKRKTTYMRQTFFQEKGVG